MNSQTLYDTDFNSWIEQHIILLKQGRFNEIDTIHLIEELEDMGKSNYRELENCLIVLIAHLLKWQYQAEARSNSWKSTINEQRRRLNRLLKDVPSLKNKITETVNNVYYESVESAHDETNIAIDFFPKNCPYSNEELLNKDFYPN